MRFIASSVLLAACAHLALASPIKTEDGLSAGVDNPAEESGNIIDGSGNIIDRSIKDIEHAPNQLEARGSIFDLVFCFRGLPPLTLENTVNMDQYWNLAVAGRGGVANWVTAPGNDDDLQYRAYTNRVGGVAHANLEIQVNPLAHFPTGATVRWSVTENRSGTRTCVASGTLTNNAASARVNFVLDSTASYTLTIQDAYE